MPNHVDVPEGVKVWRLSCLEQWDVQPVNEAAVEATKLRGEWPTDCDVVALSDLPAITAKAVEAERERVRAAAELPPGELLDAAAEEYRMALGLIRDLLKDAERIYEPGHEDPPHIAAARDLTEHRGTIAAIEKLAAALDQEGDTDGR